jgi:hypothetical protein
MSTAAAKIIVWYHLVDARGDSYKNAAKSAVWMAPNSMILQVRQAVVDGNKNSLGGFDAFHLHIFASLEALRANEELTAGKNISEISTTEDTPLYVVVPSTKRRKITQEFEFEFVPFTFQPLPETFGEGHVVTITHSEEGRNRDVPLFIRQHLVDKLAEMEVKFETTDLLRLYATGAPGWKDVLLLDVGHDENEKREKVAVCSVSRDTILDMDF